MTEERLLINKLIETFQITDVDFMGDVITIDNPLQYHHIVFKEDGGETTIDNGALLTAKSHALFHKICHNDYVTGRQLTRTFKELIKTNKPPTKDYYEKVSYYIEKYQKRNPRKRVK